MRYVNISTGRANKDLKGLINTIIRYKTITSYELDYDEGDGLYVLSYDKGAVKVTKATVNTEYFGDCLLRYKGTWYEMGCGRRFVVDLESSLVYKRADIEKEFEGYIVFNFCMSRDKIKEAYAMKDYSRIPQKQLRAAYMALYELEGYTAEQLKGSFVKNYIKHLKGGK